ncbi:MAG: efflux transporter outer membrane subunit, partial [Pseudomonadota bacterium]
MKTSKFWLLVSVSCLLFSVSCMTACSLAPELKNPIPKPPEKFKEAKDAIPLKKAEPSDHQDRGKWWKIFGDERLNKLEEDAIEANQSIKAAAARVKQARAEAGVARGGLFPDIGITGSAKSQGGTNAVFPGAASYRQEPIHLYTLNGTISYEFDLLGKISDSYLSALYLTQGQDATYKSLLLALQADVAQSYFSIRLLDEQIRALKVTVKIREKASDYIKHQLDAGTSSEIDYTRVQAEMATAKAELYATEKQRANLEHALATLLGKNPSEFSFEYSPLPENQQPPSIPSGIPSKLLERRPDIAAAERSMAAANSRIGVARTAFFPSISLTASGGSQSSDFPKLFQWISHTWAIGPSVNIPVFQGGSNFANLD